MDADRICFHCMEILDRPGQICPHCGWDNARRANDTGELPATVLNGMYFIGRKLGRGGFGITYLGRDMNLGRRVAVKEYYPSEMAMRHGDARTVRPYSDRRDDYVSGQRRAMDEARRIVQMERIPNVVQVYGAFEENGTVYIVMEYIEGQTLAALVREQGPLSWARVRELMWPVMSALESVHRRGVIHRDISPDNIMLSRHGNAEQTYLLDFGAARSYADNPGRMSKTVRQGYAPPEQYSTAGTQDVRTDEYALCATIYYLLTGETPRDSTQLLVMGQTMPPPRAMGSNIPEQAEAALMRGLSPRMEDRYISLKELRDAFDQLPKPPRKKYVGIVALVCAVVVAGAVWGVTRKINPPTPVGAELTSEPTEEVIQELAVNPTEEQASIPTEEQTAEPTEELIQEAMAASIPTEMPALAPTPEAPVLAVEPNEGSKPRSFHTEDRGDVIEQVYTLEAADEYQLSWASEGAASYAVRLAGVDGSEILNVSSTKQEQVPVSADDLIPGEIYELRVNARSEGDELGADASQYFMINPTPTPEPTPSPTPSPTPEPTPLPVSEWPVMLNEGFEYQDNKDDKVPGSNISRRSIATITFLDSLGDAPTNAWDMSAKKDRSVLAWIQNHGDLYDLVIAGEGGVRAPEDSNHLFTHYTNLTALSFNDSFDTSNVTNMWAMFVECFRLTELDLSEFDTSNVTNMSYMFSNCRSLTELNVSSFDTSNVTDMRAMFIDCAQLENIRFGPGFVTKQADDSRMFSGCAYQP